MDKSAKDSSVSADSRSKGGTEQTGSKEQKTPSLDELLASFGKSEAKEPDKGKAAEGESDLAALRAEIEELKASLVAKDDDQDFARMTSDVKGDLDVPDYLIDGWLRQRAKDDPRIVQAFDKRTEIPKEFKSVVNGLKEAFSSEYSARYGKKDTTGARVRGAQETRQPSTDGFDDVDWASLSSQEFEEKSLALFRQMGAK